MPSCLSALNLAEFVLGPIVLLSLLGLAFLSHRIGRVPIAFSPIFAAACLILSLHLAAYALLLPQVARGIYVLGLAAPLLIALGPREAAMHQGPLRRLRAALGDFLRFISQPCIAVFAFVSLAFWFSLLGYTFSAWDEFSHWARCSRHFIEHHRLPAGSSDGVLFGGYPPAGAVFHYFVYTNVTSSPVLDRGHEGIVAGAHCLLQFLIIPLLLSEFCRSRAVAASVVVLIAGILQKYFGHGVNSLLIDYVLTVFYAATVLGYFILKQQGRSVLLLIPCLAVLPLVKDIGLVLAGLAVFVIAVDMVFCANGKLPTKLILIAVLIAVPFGTRTAWTSHLQHQNIPDIFGAKRLSISSMLREISPSASALSQEVRANFFRALATEPVGRSSLVIAILPFAAYLYRLYHGTAERSDWVLALTLPLTIGAYIFAHLFFYLLLAFSDYERLMLASFDRYIYIYTGAVCLVMLGRASVHRPSTRDRRASQMFTEVVENLYIKLMTQVNLPHWFVAPIQLFLRIARRIMSPRAVWAGAAVITALVAYTPPYQMIRPKLTPYPPIQERVQYASSWETIRREVPPNKSLFMVWQKSNGGEIYISGYELMPRKHNVWYFSVGTPLNEKDVWTQTISADQLKKEMKDYDYVWLGATDDDFWQRYGAIFGRDCAATRHEFYRIEKNADASVSFQPITMRR